MSVRSSSGGFCIYVFCYKRKIFFMCFWINFFFHPFLSLTLPEYAESLLSLDENKGGLIF